LPSHTGHENQSVQMLYQVDKARFHSLPNDQSAVLAR
jgi:hypothetical protein